MQSVLHMYGSEVSQRFGQSFTQDCAFPILFQAPCFPEFFLYFLVPLPAPNFFFFLSQKCFLIGLLAFMCD